MTHHDEGRACAACNAISRRLLWSPRGRPTLWLLLLAGLCALVAVAAAEKGRQAESGWRAAPATQSLEP